MEVLFCFFQSFHPDLVNTFTHSFAKQHGTEKNNLYSSFQVLQYMYIQVCGVSGCSEKQAGFIHHEALTGDFHGGLIHYNIHGAIDTH